MADSRCACGDGQRVARGRASLPTSTTPTPMSLARFARRATRARHWCCPRPTPGFHSRPPPAGRTSICESEHCLFFSPLAERRWTTQREAPKGHEPRSANLGRADEGRRQARCRLGAMSAVAPASSVGGRQRTGPGSCPQPAASLSLSTAAIRWRAEPSLIEKDGDLPPWPE
jgi:hypothetical protein